MGDRSNEGHGGPGQQGLRPFDQSLPMALLRAREQVMRSFRPVLAEHGLTEQQWRVLRFLADADRPREMGEIAAGTLLLGPSLTRIVANLAELGLVRRRPAAHDQRRMMVGLSAAGRQLAGHVAPLVEQAYADIERCFGADRLAELLTLLDEVVDASSPDARSADVAAAS